MSEIRIGRHVVGPDCPCFIIAEAGVNHNGNRQTAHDLIDAAGLAGADAVKFQTWITERICAKGAKKAAYQDVNCPEEADQFTMLKRLELPYEWHSELQQHAHARGLTFLSTPDEIQSAKFLCELGMPAIKVGSAELSNHLYLRELASLGKPLILSTGMGNLEEIRAAVAVIKSVAHVPLALLHCISAYPAAEEEMNLRCLSTLRDEFATPVGLSDHSTGALSAIVAVGIGMNILEKHITLDKRSCGPDHSASADPDEFAELVRMVRRAERTLGNGVKVLAASEVDTRAAVRRTLLYARDIAKGQSLEAEDVVTLRSAVVGLGPEEAIALKSQILRRSVKAGEPISRSDFE